MNDRFYEKGNFKHKEKCKRFISDHISDVKNHQVGLKALKLSNKLIGSLLRSQRSFDWRVKCEINYIESLTSDIAKEIAIIKFNNKKIALVLDADSHKVLDDLETIFKNNF